MHPHNSSCVQSIVSIHAHVYVQQTCMDVHNIVKEELVFIPFYWNNTTIEYVVSSLQYKLYKDLHLFTVWPDSSYINVDNWPKSVYSCVFLLVVTEKEETTVSGQQLPHGAVLL